MSGMLVINVPGEIRGKGAIRMNGRIGFLDSKTRNMMTWVKVCAIEQVGQPCLEGPLTLSVEVTVPIPASWSKKKQAMALAGLIRPTGKPDASNRIKMLEDALNQVVWKDDSQLVDVRLVKRYGTTPGAVLEVGAA
jgi:Holliday junction resolvase RusA-like endonuclease